jgi:hypothetical protein
MKQWKQIVLSFALLVGVGGVVLPASNVMAINVIKDQCTTVNPSSTICQAATKDDSTKMTRTIINVMLQVLGILAVIMIIVGGIRYTISNGDASRVKAAKDTITYAVVGLIVALLSYAIVNFVIGKF